MLIPAAVRVKTLFSELEKIETEINTLLSGGEFTVASGSITPATEEKQGSGRRSWSAVKGKPCCGSKIHRHKKACSAAANKVESSIKPADLPGVQGYKCEKCGFTFLFRGDYLDARCPDCRSTNVTETGDRPDSKDVFSQEPDV